MLFGLTSKTMRQRMLPEPRYALINGSCSVQLNGQTRTIHLDCTRPNCRTISCRIRVSAEVQIECCTTWVSTIGQFCIILCDVGTGSIDFDHGNVIPCSKFLPESDITCRRKTRRQGKRNEERTKNCKTFHVMKRLVKTMISCYLRNFPWPQLVLLIFFRNA